jgi:alpha-ketoglutarate-dependent taurine dioxygenase
LCAAFGVDLGSADGRSDDQLASLVIEAVDEHHVVKVRGVDWDTSEQLDWTARIGTIVGERDPRSTRSRPSVRHERGEDRYADRWHADLSWSSTDAISVLVCTEIDRHPDPTLFLDTSAAVAGLDGDLMKRITERSVVHDLRHSRLLRPADRRPSFVERVGRGAARRVGRWSRRRLAPVEPWPSSLPRSLCVPRQDGRNGTSRPLVDRCPRTGVLFLRVGDHAWQVSGLDTEASQLLLRDLDEAIDRPANVWQQEWQVGDVVVYDNRMVLHRRAGLAGSPPGRVLRRTLAERRSGD